MKERYPGNGNNNTKDTNNGKLTRPNDLAPYEQNLGNIPHEELVGHIRDTLAEAKEDWERRWGPSTFDPVMYLGETLTNKAISEGLSNTVRPIKSDKARRLSLAWDALTVRRLQQNESYKQTVRAGVEAGSREYGQHITLDEDAVKLLDAMAEAVGVHRTRGERIVDLSQTAPVERQRKTLAFRSFLRLFTKK